MLRVDLTPSTLSKSAATGLPDFLNLHDFPSQASVARMSDKDGLRPVMPPIDGTRRVRTNSHVRHRIERIVGLQPSGKERHWICASQLSQELRRTVLPPAVGFIPLGSCQR